MADENKLTKIKLDDERLPDLYKGLKDIEDLMEIHIDHQNIEQVAEHLAATANLLHITGRLLEIATRIYDYSKGVAAYQVAKNVETKGITTTLQVKIIEGLISNHSALYARTDRTVKSVTIYLEALRSILSKNKEQQKQEAYNSNT